MKLSLDWLREWIDLPESLAELEERLTLGGLEIEGVERRGPDLSELRVGHVVACEAHPNADRLSLCRVELGESEPLEIVCGAPNVAAGQKVAVAPVGARLPDGTRIQRTKIRGVTSNGMICSALELGLGDAHATAASPNASGILVLDAAAPAGASLAQVLPRPDVVLDVSITPNRGDWVSLLGMAREVRAHYGGALRLPACAAGEGERPTAADLRVAIEARGGCHRYVARVVRGVRVAPSPLWLQERLASAGLRPINNVVDVTNLVMLEFGQPLHAFDLARLRGGALCVRCARPGEKLVTLDGQTRQLEADDLVIADAEGALAIAGVMGGVESQVGEGTRDVLLESAHFRPAQIRRTARRLGLQTDASYRFERGVDRGGVARAAERAARLVAELAGGSVSRGAVEALGEALPPVPEIALDPARLNRLLGTRLAPDEIRSLLARVEVSAREADGLLRCTPPEYRNDLALPEDLVEEVARIHGYDRIEPTLPEGPFAGSAQPRARALAHAVRDALVGAGLIEIMTFSAGRPADLEALRLDSADPRRRCVAIRNPILALEPVLRSTLVPSLLRAAQQNLSRQVDALRLFEVGRVFLARAPGELPDEPPQAAALLGGSGPDGLWERRDVPVFFHAKGVGQRVLDELGVAWSFHPGSAEPFLHPAAAGEFRVGRESVGAVGELHPETAAAFDLEVPLALLLLDLAALERCGRSVPRFEEVSRQPRVRRDLALLLDAGVRAGEVLEAVRKAGGEALRSVAIFDRYAGKGVPEGKVSLAFRLDFQRADRALTDAEVAKVTDKVVRLLSRQFGGELR